ncbi:MAG: hypothetical protein M3450_20765 [Actinomycetota bacterium]|nr:hypothetical protein [Actinomycetota bacterium]
MSAVTGPRPLVPRRQVCPTCAHDDDVAVMPLPDGLAWQYSCSSVRHADPYLWTVTAEARLDLWGGITAELGLYDDLPRCFSSGEQYVEHGVVEHRYKLLRPDVYFDELVPRYGHVAQGPRRYSTSSFIAGALGRLYREGVLAWQWGSATGFFQYNGQISYWALKPAPDDGELLTWESFARRDDLDPWAWSLDRPR